MGIFGDIILKSHDFIRELTFSAIVKFIIMSHHDEICPESESSWAANPTTK